MHYFTYDASGAITGAYVQELLPEHAARYIEVTPEQYRGRHAFRVQDGVLAPKPMPSPSQLLATQRAQQWDAIKAHRDHLSENGGYSVTVDGVAKWFHSDVKSRSQQLGLVLAGAGIPAGLQWKTMDGTFVTMTQALAGAIFQAAMAQEQAIFAKAEQHKAAMEAATDPLAYDFTTGWPAVYGA